MEARIRGARGLIAVEEGKCSSAVEDGRRSQVESGGPSQSRNSTAGGRSNPGWTRPPSSCRRNPDPKTTVSWKHGSAVRDGPSQPKKASAVRQSKTVGAARWSRADRRSPGTQPQVAGRIRDGLDPLQAVAAIPIRRQPFHGSTDPRGATGHRSRRRQVQFGSRRRSAQPGGVGRTVAVQELNRRWQVESGMDSTPFKLSPQSRSEDNRFMEARIRGARRAIAVEEGKCSSAVEDGRRSQVESGGPSQSRNSTAGGRSNPGWTRPPSRCRRNPDPKTTVSWKHGSAGRDGPSQSKYATAGRPLVNPARPPDRLPRKSDSSDGRGNHPPPKPNRNPLPPPDPTPRRPKSRQTTAVARSWEPSGSGSPRSACWSWPSIDRVETRWVARSSRRCRGDRRWSP